MKTPKNRFPKNLDPVMEEALRAKAELVKSYHYGVAEMFRALRVKEARSGVVLVDRSGGVSEEGEPLPTPLTLPKTRFPKEVDLVMDNFRRAVIRRFPYESSMRRLATLSLFTPSSTALKTLRNSATALVTKKWGLARRRSRSLFRRTDYSQAQGSETVTMFKARSCVDLTISIRLYSR